VGRIIAVLAWIVLLPFRIAGLALGVIGRLMGTAAEPLLLRVDSSSALSQNINRLSSSMATQRGFLLLVGTVILVVSLVVHVVVLIIMVSTDSFDRSLYWLCIPFVLEHVGVLAGFTGAMLATPLGQGYKDE
jgi:hypothetical protein